MVTTTMEVQSGFDNTRLFWSYMSSTYVIPVVNCSVNPSAVCTLKYSRPSSSLWEMDCACSVASRLKFLYRCNCRSSLKIQTPALKLLMPPWGFVIQDQCIIFKVPTIERPRKSTTFTKDRLGVKMLEAPLEYLMDFQQLNCSFLILLWLMLR